MNATENPDTDPHKRTPPRITAPNYPKCKKCLRRKTCVEYKVYQVTFKDAPYTHRFFYSGNLRGAQTYWKKCHPNVLFTAIKTFTYTGVSYWPCETSQLFYSPTRD